MLAVALLGWLDDGVPLPAATPLDKDRVSIAVPDHKTKLPALDETLKALGKRLVVSVEYAA
ncbi:hypothetical protein [Breoghania sp.]|uniref:hypothetical protein n=1 Tax=Breoghania sp. TaxID=2065378 RepID=UPI00262AF734|nr:hypothetical protein [Breoghania sp.]MDJ0931651.1 hypothetical protein [Breoghania sp.]